MGMPITPPKAVKRTSRPPGSRTEQHNKSRLKSDFGGMSDMLRPKAKLQNTKPRLK